MHLIMLQRSNQALDMRRGKEPELVRTVGTTGLPISVHPMIWQSKFTFETARPKYKLCLETLPNQTASFESVSCS